MGGARDRRSIPLATMLGTPIGNVRRDQRDPRSMRAAVKMLRKQCPTAVPRSMRSTYDCLGMIFASRRTCVGVEKNIGPVLRLILQEDGYLPVPSQDALSVGDVVVYKFGDSCDDSSISHVSMVVQNEPLFEGGSRQIMALSQWGADGEYYHRMDDVPLLLGKPAEFWTHRWMDQ